MTSLWRHQKLNGEEAYTQPGCTVATHLSQAPHTPGDNQSLHSNCRDAALGLLIICPLPLTSMLARGHVDAPDRAWAGSAQGAGARDKVYSHGRKGFPSHAAAALRRELQPISFRAQFKLFYLCETYHTSM